MRGRRDEASVTHLLSTSPAPRSAAAPRSMLLASAALVSRRTKPRLCESANFSQKKNCPVRQAGWQTGLIGQTGCANFWPQPAAAAAYTLACAPCRSKAADCTVIGEGEAEWSLRDNIVGDSAAASASVLGIRKRSDSYYNFGVGIRGNRALLCYSHTTTTTYVCTMYVMMNSHTKSGIYIRIFSLIRNGI